MTKEEPREYVSVHYASPEAMVGRHGTERRKKRGSLFLKVIVSTLILSIIAYVVTVFYFVWHGIYPPDSLNYTFLPSIIGQLGITGMITRKNKEVEIEQLRQQNGYQEENIL